MNNIYCQPVTTGFTHIKLGKAACFGAFTAYKHEANKTFWKQLWSQGACSLYNARCRVQTRNNSGHHAQDSRGPCPRFLSDLYDYCRIIGMTEQLYSLLDDLIIRGEGEQYLSYHLHCECHNDWQMTKYNDFFKMSLLSKFTKHHSPDIVCHSA